MKLVRFMDDSGAPRWGRLVDGGVARPLVGDLFGSHRFDEAAIPVRRRVAPVMPSNIIAIGRNYREHAAEMKADDVPAEPLVFLKATSSVIGPEDDIVLPSSAPSEVDYEAELAVIIGRAARNVSERTALEYVFGYTCANDVTARDCQKRRDKQWARGKSFDTFCPLGPVIVTTDELDPMNCPIRMRLNGETMQDGNTADMIFPIAHLIHYLSHQFTLLPGTVILTGTPSGVGFAREPQVFLKPGDAIEVDIAPVGVLRQHVRAAAL